MAMSLLCSLQVFGPPVCTLFAFYIKWSYQVMNVRMCMLTGWRFMSGFLFSPGCSTSSVQEDFIAVSTCSLLLAGCCHCHWLDTKRWLLSMSKCLVVTEFNVKCSIFLSSEVQHKYLHTCLPWPPAILKWRHQKRHRLVSRHGRMQYAHLIGLYVFFQFSLKFSPYHWTP